VGETGPQRRSGMDVDECLGPRADGAMLLS
jgi:hypothetical protein